MTRHSRKLNSRPQTFFYEHIAVANTARFDFHTDLTSARLRNIALDQFPVTTCSTYLSGLHLVPHAGSLLDDRVSTRSGFWFVASSYHSSAISCMSMSTRISDNWHTFPRRMTSTIQSFIQGVLNSCTSQKLMPLRVQRRVLLRPRFRGAI